jgi:aspartyl-tRNA(Asn)/glutamyl-tRNA(Gln) amidotransferase subunit C
MAADPAISPEQVRHVAKLARLALDEPQLARFAPQLESILEYVGHLGEVDVANVEPMAHASHVSNVFRDDVAGPGLPLDKVLQNAPETDGPFFKVPKVIGAEEDSAE